MFVMGVCTCAHTRACDNTGSGKCDAAQNLNRCTFTLVAVMHVYQCMYVCMHEYAYMYTYTCTDAARRP